jgi:hypothetical protein
VARAHGAALLTAQEFANRLFVHAPKHGTTKNQRQRMHGDKPANPEVDFWLEQFKKKKKR